MVCEGRHGSITIEYRGQALECREIAAPARPSEYAVKVVGERASRPHTKRKCVPAANHPWRRSWCLLARDFSKKAQAEEKSSEHRPQKGDISIEVRQGTFLSSFDSRA